MEKEGLLQVVVFVTALKIIRVEKGSILMPVFAMLYMLLPSRFERDLESNESEISIRNRQMTTSTQPLKLT